MPGVGDIRPQAVVLCIQPRCARPTGFVHRDALFLLKQAAAIEADATPAEMKGARD